MAIQSTYDIIVIGAGPGGTAAAVRGAQRGARVLLVEKDRLGGTCLNRGCIPAKTLLQSAVRYRELQRIGQYGIRVGGGEIDLSAVQKRKVRIVDQLHAGIKRMIDSYRIEHISGEAIFKTDNSVFIGTADGAETGYTAGHYIIATGSVPRAAVGFKGNGSCIGTAEALDLEWLPRSVVIVGAGPIGLEFASLFSMMGSQVDLIEVLPGILPAVDEEVRGVLQKELIRQGIRLHLKSTVIACGEQKVTVLSEEGNEFEIPAEVSIWAGGRKPCIDALGLDAAKVACTKQGITVDGSMRTSNKRIFAIGDAAGRMLLAYTASAEGVIAVETIAGNAEPIDYEAVPQAVYCEPNIAWAGLTFADAVKKVGRHNVRVGTFPLLSSGKAAIIGQRSGLMRIVTDIDGRILGVHIVGHDAAEIIPIAAQAVRNKTGIDEWRRESFPHPTIVESLFGAGEDCFSRSVELPRKNI